MAELTVYAVEQWIKTVATGEFHYTKVLDGNVDKKSYAKLREYIGRCCKKGVCESLGRRDGYYRPIQESPLPVDFSGVKDKTDFPVELPFNLRKYVFIYPNTIIIVAGSKNAGKSGFLYRTVAMNMNKVNTILLSNMEGGEEQMYDRFLAMGIDLTLTPKFIWRVNDNFHDFIKQPDTLYVIDYIDVPEELYLVGALITKILRKLQNSVAVIGLQKPSWRDVAFGGEGTLKDATLYLAMDNSRLKIRDAKVPANDKLIPRNMEWSFTYNDAGTSFTITQSPVSPIEEEPEF